MRNRADRRWTSRLEVKRNSDHIKLVHEELEIVTTNVSRWHDKKVSVFGEERMKTMKMKRIISTIIAVSMSFIFSVPVYAIGSAGTQSSSNNEFNIIMTEDYVNEYDYIVAVRNMTSMDLLENGVSPDKVSYYRSDAPEQELLYRATLSEEILRNYYCYSDEAIELIKNYDGTPLEDAPEMRAATATMTAGLGELLVTSTCIGILYTCTWQSKPLDGGEDAAGVAWEGTYANGGNNNATLSLRDSYAQIIYRDYLGDHTEIFDVNSKDLHNNAYVEFEFEKDESTAADIRYQWAKTTSLFVYVDLANPDGPEFVEHIAHGEYGHTEYDATAGIGFPWGVSISFYDETVIYGDRNLVIHV